MRTSDPEGLVKLETAMPCLEVTGAVNVDCCGISPVQDFATPVCPWYEVQGN